VSICVPTPLRKTKDPDISHIVYATKEIMKYLHRDQLIVLESTTYPGTTDEIILPELEAQGFKVGYDFFLVFSPERVDPGNKIYRIKNTPKILGGVTPRCTEVAKALYSKIIDTVVPVSSTKSAEMVKLLENTFRAVNIGLVNEVALMCDRLEVNVWEVVEAASTKPFGFMPFYPGPGLGGHCLNEEEYLFIKSKEGIETVPIGKYFARLSQGSQGKVEQYEDVTLLIPHDVEILSFDSARQEICYKPLLALFRRPYSGKMVKIVTEDGRKMRMTEKHPMIVLEQENPETKLAEDLLSGDQLIIATGMPQPHEQASSYVIDLIPHLNEKEIENIGVTPKTRHFSEFKRRLTPLLTSLGKDYWEIYRSNRMPLKLYLDLEKAGAMPLEQAEIFLCTGRGSSWNRIPAVIEIDEGFSRLVGYYLSEGCITQDGSLRTRFTFHSEEKEYIADLTSLIEKIGIKYSIYRSKECKASHIKVSSHLFGRLLRDILECGTNCYNMAIPDHFFLAPESFRVSLLSGLFRGDGDVHHQHGQRKYRKNSRTYIHHFNTATVGFFSSSPTLFQQTVLLLQGLGFIPTFKRGKPQLRLYGEEQLSRLLPLFDGEKRRKLENYQQGRRRSMLNKSSRRHETFATVSIKEVSSERTTDEMVYSVEVEDTHTFVTSYGIVTHNCIPIDPHYLSWKLKTLDYKARFIELADDINANMPFHVVTKITDALNNCERSVKGSKIMILGIAYKKDIGDVRESKALDIIKILQQKGADVFYHDPYVQELSSLLPAHPVELNPQMLSSADCVVIVTDHSCYDYPSIVEHARIVMDTRNATKHVKEGREKIVTL